MREFYRLCDGGHLANHNWFAVGELLDRNRGWWDLLRQYPRPSGGPIDPIPHVVLAEALCGFPIVWHQRTDEVAHFFYRDRDDLSPTA
jgi:hypothetical protein